MAVARATSPFMPQIGLASCQRNQMLLPVQSEKAKHKYHQMILWKSSVCVFKRSKYVSCQKEQERLNLALHAVTANQGTQISYNIMNKVCFFCKYNCTAMSESSYLSCNYVVFSAHLSQSSIKVRMYIHTHCLHRPCTIQGFQKDL